MSMYSPVNMYFPFRVANQVGHNAAVIAYTFDEGEHWNIWFIPGTWVDED